MRTILVLAAVVIVGLLPSAPAQAPPDFSGRWAIETAPVAPPAGAPAAAAGRPDQGALARGDMSSGWGSPLTITQNPTQLIVEQTLFSRYDFAQQPRSVYAFDGSETRNEIMIGHSTQVRTSRAEWAGQSLRIVTRYPGVDPSTGKAFTTEVTHRLTLESPASLVMDVTRAGALGGKELRTRVVYKKSS